MPIFALSASQSVAAGVAARAEAAPMPKRDGAGDPAEVTQSAARSARQDGPAGAAVQNACKVVVCGAPYWPIGLITLPNGFSASMLDRLQVKSAMSGDDDRL
jgi:hypothetical protein